MCFFSLMINEELDLPSVLRQRTLWVTGICAFAVLLFQFELGDGNDRFSKSFRLIFLAMSGGGHTHVVAFSFIRDLGTTETWRRSSPTHSTIAYMLLICFMSNLLLSV